MTATQGQGSEYVLFFPFSLPPGQQISGISAGVRERKSGDLIFRLTEKNGIPQFTVGRFTDEAMAASYVSRVYAGILWAALNQNLSPEASLDLQDIARPDDPVEAARNFAKSTGLTSDRLDGIIDTAFPAVYRANDFLRYVSAGSINAILGYNPEDTLKYVADGAAFSHSERVLADAKLRVAIDLFKGFVRESSDNARFLTLTMALEALAPNELKTAAALKAIEGWMREIDALQNPLNSSSDDWIAYDSLRREIGFRKEVSIRQRVRTLVRDTLRANGDADTETVAREALRLYDKRSTLVHEGSLPTGELQQAISPLRDIVRRVLVARFRSLAA